MTEPAFVYQTDIATTPERLWAALTSGELTQQYWFDRRIESSWTDGEPVRFYDGASDVVTDSGTVLEAVPYRTLSYSFRQEAAAHREPGAEGLPEVLSDLRAEEDLRFGTAGVIVRVRDGGGDMREGGGALTPVQEVSYVL